MEIIGGILGDCLSVKGVAVSGTATGVVTTAIGKMMAKRHNMLREIVLSELRQGNFENVDQDELVAIFFRLIRDAEEGAARNNLRLMTRVINGMAEKKELTAPSFLKYANILASLTEDEITALGIMVRYKDVTDNKGIKERAAELERQVPHSESVLQALMRTGLIKMKTNTLADLSEGTYKFCLSPLMDEILKYIPDMASIMKEAA